MPMTLPGSSGGRKSRGSSGSGGLDRAAARSCSVMRTGLVSSAGNGYQAPFSQSTTRGWKLTRHLAMRVQSRDTAGSLRSRGGELCILRQDTGFIARRWCAEVFLSPCKFLLRNMHVDSSFLDVDLYEVAISNKRDGASECCFGCNVANTK